MTQDREEILKDLLGTFKRVNHIMHAYYRNIAPSLKPGHFFVFMRLKRDTQNDNKGLRVSDIAASLGISAPAVTQILGELEKDKLIRREMDPEDRRAVRVFLTPGGLALMAPAFDKLHEIFNGLIDHLGEENSRTLTALLAETEQYIAKEIGSKDSVGGVSCN